jgi:hypothetical protein
MGASKNIQGWVDWTKIAGLVRAAEAKGFTFKSYSDMVITCINFTIDGIRGKDFNSIHEALEFLKARGFKVTQAEYEGPRHAQALNQENQLAELRLGDIGENDVKEPTMADADLSNTGEDDPRYPRFKKLEEKVLAGDASIEEAGEFMELRFVFASGEVA